MDKTNYDEASRYLGHQGDAPVIRWLLRLREDQVGFDGFLNSVLTLPGSKQRICDLVVRLRDLSRNGVPVAGLVEFQTKPAPDMFGRMLLAGAICWQTVRPSNLPGDRYELCAVVVNLTGTGDSARHMHLGASEWSLKPVEVNLSTLDAGEVLDQVEAGEAPADVLAWVSVMQRGDDPSIVQRWLAIASEVDNLARRGDFGLVVLFANAVGRKELWEKALEGWKMEDVSIVKEWKAKAHSAGKLEGKRESKREDLIRILERRWPPVPPDVEARIRDCTDLDELNRWMDFAISAASVEQFRQDTGV